MTTYSKSCIDKDMGDFRGCFWFAAWWGAWEVLGLVGKEGSKLRCSKFSQGWNVVNKDLFFTNINYWVTHQGTTWTGPSLLGNINTPWHLLALVILPTLKHLRSQSRLLLSNYIHSLCEISSKSQGFKYACILMNSKYCLQPWIFFWTPDLYLSAGTRHLHLGG